MSVKTIFLPALGRKVPVLGFGCSSLAGTDRKNALRALGAAFDAGVRHFDVARYYGLGEAEGILGEFAKNHRSEITITTKFGMEPPKQSSALRVALRAGRQFVRFFPAARSAMHRQANTLVKTGKFGVEEARKSFETSLRELGTDHVEFLLLHGYSRESQASHDLLGFLEGLKEAGKICAYGIGTGFDQALEVLASQPKLCDVMQFESSVVARTMEKLPSQPKERLVITFGALSRGYRSVLSFLKSSPETTKKWSSQIGVDCSDADTVSALMLNYAAESNPNGLVLFSTKDAARAAKNVKAVLEPDLSVDQVSLFGRIVSREFLPHA
jgi:D-threo-aldose 1-dehydrogenase